MLWPSTCGFLLKWSLIKYKVCAYLIIGLLNSMHSDYFKPVLLHVAYTSLKFW